MVAVHPPFVAVVALNVGVLSLISAEPTPKICMTMPPSCREAPTHQC
jgi:hypothetical protein